MSRVWQIAKFSALPAAVGLVAWGRGSEVTAAELFAVAVLLLVTRALFATGPERPVALKPFKYGSNNESVDAAGLEVPAEALKDQTVEKGVDYDLQRGLFFRGLYLGKDGRWSTSKLQVLLWTYAVLFALTAIFLAKALGVDEGLSNLIEDGDKNWDVYLILLGGPFAAMVLAQGITSTKVENESVAKTNSEEPTTAVGEGLSQVISNDVGETDIVDLQYFLFNLLALGYFLGSFVPNLADGLPKLPELLVALTGASAATYVAKKATDREKPSVTAVLPVKARTGGKLDIWGRSLVLGERSRPDRKPRVSIGSTEVPDDEVTIVADTGALVDHLRCTVPTTAERGSTTLRIVTLAGVSAESPLEVETGVHLNGVSSGKIELAAPGEITVFGENFGSPGPGSAVLLGDVPLVVRDWTEKKIIAALDAERLGRNAYVKNEQAKLVVQDGNGQRSEAWTLQVV
jgi:hypothetical protein